MSTCHLQVHFNNPRTPQLIVAKAGTYRRFLSRMHPLNIYFPPSLILIQTAAASPQVYPPLLFSPCRSQMPDLSTPWPLLVHNFSCLITFLFTTAFNILYHSTFQPHTIYVLDIRFLKNNNKTKFYAAGVTFPLWKVKDFQEIIHNDFVHHTSFFPQQENL